MNFNLIKLNEEITANITQRFPIIVTSLEVDLEEQRRWRFDFKETLLVEFESEAIDEKLFEFGDEETLEP